MPFSLECLQWNLMQSYSSLSQVDFSVSLVCWDWQMYLYEAFLFLASHVLFSQICDFSAGRGILLTHSFPWAPHKCQIERAPHYWCYLSLLPLPCAGTISWVRVLSCWNFELLHLIKLYLISFVFSPFVSEKRLQRRNEIFKKLSKWSFII